MGQTTWHQGWFQGRKYRKEEVIRKNIRVGWIRGCFWTSWEQTWLWAEGKTQVHRLLLAPTNQVWDEIPKSFPIAQRVWMPFVWTLDCISFVLFTLGLNILVLLPREMADLFMVGAVSFAFYPSPKVSPPSRYICIRGAKYRKPL